ncbi:DNA-binding response regulator [Enterovibrio norvegicus FF-33]|uniref:DNA-binding response regulator n=1 Tax=Enterovibrio norvegicus FF-454 TaxID=1185651 RepID=A0A1E5BWX4_9GAMM|nr:response regulator [Enterovibrio norvegicus]OEE57773.1 DNA-binding response regulator [Enterovibrio norvegicus FF-454]OEE67542.1 DNA-binding response regulator [Enterovibrio norvegicus FF-33]OEE76704.1 DNA-binding response regulator [Enterovibrio norvegicus FF-162]
MNTWNVLLVDDHPLMRKGISQLLKFEPEFNTVSEASNGTDAIAEVSRSKPDLIVLDLNMKGLSGLDTLKALRYEGCTATIVILTVSDSPNDIHAIIQAGADGYLLKDSEPEELIEKLKVAMTGKKAFSKEVEANLANNEKNASPLTHLTERELQILQQVAKGLRNKQIAESLYISEATVKVHLKNLLKKLNVDSRVAATVLYLENETMD